MWTFDEFRRSSLENIHPSRFHRRLSQPHYKPPMMKTPALKSLRIRNMRLLILAGINDSVAVYWYSVDVVEAPGEVEVFESEDAAGLEELADDAVGFGEGAFEEGDAEGWGGGGGEGEGG